MIRAFFKEFRLWLLTFPALVLAFLATFYLYRLPLTYFWVSLAFVSLIAVICYGLAFWQFYRKMAQLQSGQLEGSLSRLDRPSDRAYQNLLAQQEQQYKQELLTYKSKEEDLASVVQMWSHQMKVPLAAIDLMNQTGQVTKTDLDSQLLSLNHYLANLLNYLKLSKQTSDFRFEEVAVRDLVVNLVKDYRVHFLQKELSIQIDGEWALKTDKKWLRFALAQILDNAIKYSQKGGSITISLSDGIIIRDQGIGILAEDLPRIFEQGFTGYNGHEHQKASGFGLYMTKSILDQLELIIDIKSQIDNGTQVTIRKK
ncbi:sensor histidine kinase [Streptococcus caprae]|uniref:histidine kinase n=1 Tax=Streptococcus caprae TaxID=1640501 RepID=A0ABV8CXL6_9STRE